MAPLAGNYCTKTETARHRILSIITIEMTAASLETALHPANLSERSEPSERTPPMNGTGSQDGVSVL
jgi:hypothetical protein